MVKISVVIVFKDELFLICLCLFGSLFSLCVIYLDLFFILSLGLGALGHWRKLKIIA